MRTSSIVVSEKNTSDAKTQNMLKISLGLSVGNGFNICACAFFVYIIYKISRSYGMYYRR